MKLALAGVGKGVFKTDYYGKARLRTWVHAVIWTTVGVLAICGLVFGIVSACRAAGAATCRNFAQQSGYASGYHVQHFLDSGTCYVQLPNGHKLPMQMVTAYLKANK